MISDIVVFLFILLFVWFGYKSGFIKSIFGILTYIISIILGILIYPIVSEYLKASPLYGVILNFSAKYTSFKIEGNSIFNSIIEQAGNQATNSIAELLLNILSFILVILMCKIILFAISKCLDIISKIPVVSFLNRISGSLIGGLKGIVLLYIISLLLNFLPIHINAIVMDDINRSSFAYKFYKENLVIDIIGKDFLNSNG